MFNLHYNKLTHLYLHFLVVPLIMKYQCMAMDHLNFRRCMKENFRFTLQLCT
jgi:hypothetical protein